jgi:hypothetical protein
LTLIHAWEGETRRSRKEQAGRQEMQRCLKRVEEREGREERDDWEEVEDGGGGRRGGWVTTFPWLLRTILVSSDCTKVLPDS